MISSDSFLPWKSENFKTQLRAILRAALGNVKLMYP